MQQLKMWMSIFPLFLLLGVASCRHVSFYDDDGSHQPIITHTQETRICAELCLSGLGGDPCGEYCQDLAPAGLRYQYRNENNSVQNISFTRENACPLLCHYNLGSPLCRCRKDDKKESKVDYVGICAFFCGSYNYQLYGCHKCDFYEKPTGNFNAIGVLYSESQELNWNEWCKEMCQSGQGGAACNCDILPLILAVN